MGQELHDLGLVNSLHVTFEGVHRQVLCSRGMRVCKEVVDDGENEGELTRRQPLLVRPLDLFEESREILGVDLAVQFLGPKANNEYSGYNGFRKLGLRTKYVPTDRANSCLKHRRDNEVMLSVKNCSKSSDGKSLSI